MTNQQTLEKAIQKAIDGGWDDILPTETWKVVTDRGLELDVDMISPYSGNHIGGRYNFMEIIFNHDFAQALWPSNRCLCGSPVTPEHKRLSGRHFLAPDWRHHLQQMVIAEDPIKYLGENI